MFSSTQTLQDEPGIDEFFNLVAVGTLTLLEYLEEPPSEIQHLPPQDGQH